jgi:hypothetical protein
MRLSGLIVLLLLAGGLFYALRRTEQTAKREQVASESLLGGRRTLDALRIVLQRDPNAPALHVGRADATEPFMLLEPIVDEASAAFLENVRGVLDTAQRFFDAPLAEVSALRLADMGLDQPRGHIEVRYPDKTFALDIGLEGPLHQDLFIKMDGNVYRTGLAVWSAIQANPDDVRERVLFRTDPDSIRRFVMRRRAGAANTEEVIELVRTGSETFRLLQPLQTTADTQAAVALISFLTGMVAEQFLSTLNPMPDWNVQVEVEGSRGTERLTLWQTPQGLIGRQEPRDVEFTIKTVNYTRTFEVAVDELRQRWLVPMSLLDIVRVEIDPGQGQGPGQGERIQLRRAAGDAMALFQPIEVPTEPGPINDLLQATQKLQVKGYVPGTPTDLAPFGLDRGFLTVSLHPRAQENRPTVLHFGKSEGDVTYVKREDDPYVAKVATAAVDALRAPWHTYASRNAAVPPPSDVDAIRYHVGGATPVTFTRKDGKWVRDAGGANATDQASELLELAGSLRGKRTFDAREPAVAHELAAARVVQIEFAATSSGASSKLSLHERPRDAAGNQQAWVVPATTPRIVVELGPADTRALLAPVSQ